MQKTFVPAAQYLRMSTDHQQYSLDNQADAIARYAREQSFQIVKTYSDAARSGLHLRNRPGLKQLLKDIVLGGVPFRAILVYDVSRWGRFQDADESAHYEYLCKSSGVPVHYCAEMFPNDNSISGLMMKALKRGMAGEYSRELSVKVRAGLFRLAKLGYKQGGHAPYGLRRQLLDTQGRPKQLLTDGERKSLANEHVVLIPGPSNEIAVVQRIFHEFADEHLSLSSIARRLNEEGIAFLRGAKWDPNTILHVIERSQYVGTHIWGRTAAFLSSPVKRLSTDKWAVCHNAFQPIIARELFDKAQTTLANMTCRLTDEQLLERLKPVLNQHGKLDRRIIQDSPLCPGHTTYHHRFGGLLNVYARLGFNNPALSAQATSRQRGMLVRRNLIKTLLETFPEQIQVFRRNPKGRELLRYRRTGRLISVVIARFRPTRKAKLRWLIESPPDERRRVTILGLMDQTNTCLMELKLFSRMDYPRLSLHARAENRWLQSGTRLEQISDFISVIQQLRC